MTKQPKPQSAHDLEIAIGQTISEVKTHSPALSKMSDDTSDTLCILDDLLCVKVRSASHFVLHDGKTRCVSMNIVSGRIVTIMYSIHDEPLPISSLQSTVSSIQDRLTKGKWRREYSNESWLKEANSMLTSEPIGLSAGVATFCRGEEQVGIEVRRLSTPSKHLWSDGKFFIVMISVSNNALYARMAALRRR